MEILNFVTFILCMLGISNMIHGEVIAVKGMWHDVKLHCRETGKIYTWKKHTKETPTVWFWTQKVYRR